jgi:hypothetical protein
MRHDVCGERQFTATVSLFMKYLPGSTPLDYIRVHWRSLAFIGG